MNKNCLVEKNGYLFLGRKVFFFLISLYSIFRFLNMSTFYPVIPTKTEKSLFLILVLITGLKLLYLFLSEKECRKNWIKLFVVSLLVAFVWMLVYRNDGYRFLPFLAVLTVGCIGSDYKKVLKLYVVVIGSSVLTAVLCALGGAITNLIYNQGTYLRSSWGICYPTDFSAYLLYISLAAWIAWDNIPDPAFLIVVAFDFLIAKEITHTNTSIFCSILFCAFIFWHMLANKFSDKKITRFLQWIADFLSCVAFPLFAVSMIGLTWAYHEGNLFAVAVNNWNHNRLSNASNMFDQVGLSLFGRPFENIGNGGTTFSVPNYNFVDCSYLLILLRYGAVTLIVVGLLWVMMTRKSIKTGDRRLALSMALIAFHSVSEHHFTEIDFNILLVLPFSVFAYGKYLPAQPSEQYRKETWIRTGFIFGIITCLLLLLPEGLTWFRTLSTITDIGSGAKRRTFLFAFVFAILLFVYYFILKSSAFFTNLALKRKPAKKNGLLLATMIVLIIPCLFIVSYTIDYAADNEYTDLLEADQDAVLLLQEADCELYIDDLPEIYRRLFGGISTSIFDGEDLSRLDNVAVICDINEDIDAFIKRGFLFTEISENHSVYTNSKEAVNVLSKAGYVLSDYYSHNCAVNMEEFSKSAGIPLSDDGTIGISAYRPLAHGPYLSLNTADYNLTFHISAFPWNTEIQNDEDEIICTIRISTRYGANIVTEQPVYRCDFDENGNLRYTLKCYIPGSPGVEFLIFPQKSDISISLEGIEYQKSNQLL